MNPDLLVSVRNISKAYQIYDSPHDRLLEFLWRGGRKLHRTFEALHEVTFDLAKGDAIGIIGVNGSGKSTLLQIIAGTISPSAGDVETRGRIAALLELGSGFNPEFTGRENVFINGTILGLSHDEIARRFDEIAEFAAIGDFIEQPIKTYSTGMVVRLAFAVQVLLEPELLIVDEALSVGDVAFQVKCMSRMQRLREQGVAVILATHDIQAVRTFCNKALWLDQGQVRALGDPLSVTSQYMQYLFADQNASVAAAAAEGTEAVPAAEAAEPEGDPLQQIELAAVALPDLVAAAEEAPEPAPRQLMTIVGPDLVRWGSGEVQIEAIALDSGVPGIEPIFEHGAPLHLEVRLRANQDFASSFLGFGFAFRNLYGLDLITHTSYEAGMRFPALRAGQSVVLSFDLKNILAPGHYSLVMNVELACSPKERIYLDFVENALMFQVIADIPIFSVVLPDIDQWMMISEEAANEPAAEQSECARESV